ncbi:serine hydrolase domain-containing protein [Maribacter sp. HTCC2170]|uniref:serine hydrolase domain-containing protein n=1 Tax=Maribacter sp. (strain HTCC2170 / KCCM 42371) TaxID=313603 RepID=UPI00006B479C|nr:serine hydrolase domain-containing protein [Maribacter sp. HTCC2170]EAR01965.1 beta-lactamase [Maribacter sp. HTCC2170]
MSSIKFHHHLIPKTNKIVLLVLIAVLFSCKQKGESTKAIATNNSPITDSLTTALRKIHGQGFINGFSVAVVNDSAVLYTKGFGFSNVAANKPYTKNTIQNIASISKTFIGISLLKAQELGKLKLDDPINDYLPYAVKNPYYPEIPITIRHLATHTSTILDTDYYGMSYVMKEPLQSLDTTKVNVPDYFNGPETRIPLNDFLEKMLTEKGASYKKEGFLNNQPGAHYEYSNCAATLAALVIEVATGTSFPEFTQTHILDPLGMTGSGWSFDAINLEDHSVLYNDIQTPLPLYSLITYPDGGFTTSSADLAKYLNELMKGFTGKGTLLQADSYTELFKKQLNPSHHNTEDGEEQSGDEHNSGIFMGFRANGQIGHSGGDPGVSTHMFFDPKTKLGRILIVNTELEQEGFEELIAIGKALTKFGNKLND